MNRDELLEQLNFYRKLVEEQGNIIESLRNSIDEMRIVPNRRIASLYQSVHLCIEN